MSLVAPAPVQRVPHGLSDRFALGAMLAHVHRLRRIATARGNPLRAAPCASFPRTRHSAAEAQVPAIDLHLSIAHLHAVGAHPRVTLGSAGWANIGSTPTHRRQVRYLPPRSVGFVRLTSGQGAEVRSAMCTSAAMINSTDEEQRP